MSHIFSSHIHLKVILICINFERDLTLNDESLAEQKQKQNNHRKTRVKKEEGTGKAYFLKNSLRRPCNNIMKQ